MAYGRMLIGELRDQAMQIARQLRARGFAAWLVGGCVRDLVLGRDPDDYDIATDARPDQLLEIFPNAQLVGAQFGVVLVGGVEVATFRSDHSYQDGRHPSEVRFETDVRQDVLRRGLPAVKCQMPNAECQMAIGIAYEGVKV